ncbi:MAG: hypothetical protein ACKOD2_09290, partial [Ilumatobacteraceae bacterium]
MRSKNSSAESTATRFADEAVRIRVANATDGGRTSTSSWWSSGNKVLQSDDPVVALAKRAGCSDDEALVLVLCVHVE